MKESFHRNLPPTALRPKEGDREHRLGETKCNHEDGAMAR